MEMGLQDCADRVIGNWHLRGISGGEAKRLSIGLEILNRPRLLFLDEPTTGLDSASAFFVVQALRSVARDGGRTVISSIHQPSGEVFALFDDLCLLSSGEVVYFGDAKKAVLGIMMMTSGFFRLLPDLPKIFWRYPISYLSFGSWAIQGSYKNDLLGLTFEPMIPGDPKLTGAYIVKHMFGVPIERSKWWDLGALFLLIFSYRVLFFVVFKIRERASPMFQTMYRKKTLNHLKKRPSFRKTSFSSKRFQPQYPLSYQEGLNSPIP